ncbi:hypothetical protein HDK90DRAFT_115985 [Phyllosticta capitalensis]|uniref:Uncharacterized protein n=1 Tax=Phyllosticta capitalensis TaxID=121624 RepID=A0ABR1YAI0_9PEZI
MVAILNGSLYLQQVPAMLMPFSLTSTVSREDLSLRRPEDSTVRKILNMQHCCAGIRGQQRERHPDLKGRSHLLFESTGLDAVEKPNITGPLGSGPQHSAHYSAGLPAANQANKMNVANYRMKINTEVRLLLVLLLVSGAMGARVCGCVDMRGPKRAKRGPTLAHHDAQVGMHEPCGRGPRSKFHTARKYSFVQRAPGGLCISQPSVKPSSHLEATRVQFSISH